MTSSAQAVDDRTPILIGAGQFTQRDVDPAGARSPVAMMAECARQAAEDAGVDARVLTQLDTVAVVNMLSWHYGNPPAALAYQIGAAPRRQLYSTVGGNTPQWLVNETAALISQGEVRCALLAGAEAVYTAQRARRAGLHLDWGIPTTGSPTVVGTDKAGSTDHEMVHGVYLPVAVYPLFENALRVHYGLSRQEHRARLGALCSSFSAVAAANPYAWFREARTADEIATPTPQNRYIGYPYTKYMNAIIDVDQAAAVLMTSVGAAREMGIPPARWVYLLGCADAHDLWFVSERVNYHSSPAIRLAGERALHMAGLGIGDVDYLDLYSCFPSAVQIGRDMLGIPPDDPRPLTVTGGLPYHGGPGNNYTMHSIATMLEKVRARPGTTALVTGLGWYLTKHAAGIYSANPPSAPWQREDPATYQAELYVMVHPPLVTEPRGRSTIETYTVLHDRDGHPMRGIVIGREADGARFVANTPPDRALLEDLEAEEAIGRPGTVTSVAGSNVFVPS
jgi:acetyl-CoA C-acetyltransferase